MKIRSLAIGLGAFAAGAAALTAGAVALALNKRGQEGDEGHTAPDLAADATPGQRAPEAFRPDIDVPMTPAEREALRPATGPAPSLVADEGGSVQGVGGDR